MYPSGSEPSYWYPGSRVIQLGDSSRNESQRAVRHAFAIRPRSITTCSTPCAARLALIARPACPPPMTTVWVCMTSLSRFGTAGVPGRPRRWIETGLRSNVDRHVDTVREHVVDRGASLGLLDDLTQHFRRRVTVDAERDADLLVPVPDLLRDAEEPRQVDVAF